MFDSLWEQLKDFLIEIIMSNLSNMFADVNAKVADIAVDVGQTPSGWNTSIFNMVRGLSDTVVIPIAGIILTFIACYELISMIIDQNNMHAIDTWMIFRWTMKTFLAVMLVTNSFDIIMAIFEAAQHIVDKAAVFITGSAELGLHMDNVEDTLRAKELSELVGIFATSFLVSATLKIVSMAIFIVIWGRILECYLYISIGPVPLATMGNKEWSSVGQNYLRAVAAIGIQGFFILVCVAVYTAMVQSIQSSADIGKAMLSCCAYSVLLFFSLLKTGSFSKAILNAH